MPFRTMLRVSPASVVAPPKKVQVMVRPLLPQLPMLFWLVVMSLIEPLRKLLVPVPEGRVIVTLLPGALASPPVDDVAKPTVYLTPLAPAARLLNATVGWLIWWAVRMV